MTIGRVTFFMPSASTSVWGHDKTASVSFNPALRCEYYSLPRALAQNQVIARSTLSQGVNTRRSSVEALGGFKPNMFAVLGDLENVEMPKHGMSESLSQHAGLRRLHARHSDRTYPTPSSPLSLNGTRKTGLCSAQILCTNLSATRRRRPSAT
jgi:hypothetical protein